MKLSEREILNQNNDFKEIKYIIKKNKKMKKKEKANKSDNSLNINSKLKLERSLITKNSTKILDNKKIETKDNNNSINNGKEYNDFNFYLIYIHLHHHDEYSPISSKHILNNYNYEESIKYDKRSLCDIFYIFLLYKQALIYTFFYKSPLEIFSFRFCYLLFTISLDFTLNALFYSQYSISKKYRCADFIIIFTFKYNIIKIIFSAFIVFIFMIIFNKIGNSIKKTIDIFREEEAKINNIKDYSVTPERRKEIVKEIEKIITIHKIKVFILFVIELLIMLFFWYYVTDFCHIYPKTQLSWLLVSFLTFILSLVFILLFSLFFSYLYILSVTYKNKCLFKIVRFIYSY